MTFYLPTFRVSVTLGYLSHSSVPPKIFTAYRVESFMGKCGGGGGVAIKTKEVLGNHAKGAQGEVRPG